MYILIVLSHDGDNIIKYHQSEELEDIAQDLREYTKQAIEEPEMDKLSEEELREGWGDGFTDLYLSLCNGKPTLEELDAGTDSFAWGDDNRKVVHIIQVTGLRMATKEFKKIL